MDQTVINGNARPASGDADAVSVASFAAPPPSVAESNYILIQTTGPLSAENKEALANTEVHLLEYKGNNVYLCGYKPKTFDPITQHLSFVEKAEVYHPGYVVEPNLKTGDQSQEVTVDVSLHPNVKAADINAVETEIASAAGVPVSHVDIEHGKVRIIVSKDRLAALARIDEVRNIHEYHEPTFFNKAAGEIMEVHQPVGLKNAIYKGKGQTVCVSDSGFDTGDKDKCHAAFGNCVLALYPLGRQDTGQADDFDGHGTHVCGSVLGNGTYKYKSGGKSEVIESPASQANLIVQALSRGWKDQEKEKSKDPRTWRVDLKGIPKSLIELFDPVHRECTIHTSSWGSKPEGKGERAKYAEAAEAIDSYAWTDKRMVILFAAGNERFVSTISYQAHAKNCITVGACQSKQPDVKIPDEDEPAGFTLNMENDPEEVADFSSKGPTSDGRIKPDVVAPGVCVLSTRTSAMYPDHYSDRDGISNDTTWMYCSGTSMATPLVAGCCAVIRGALEDNGTFDASSALVKALLINGAVPLRGRAPNNDSGFGRVNLDNSLQNVVNIGTPIKGVLAGFGDKKGAQALAKDGSHAESFSFDVTVPASFKSPTTLKVTLAYTDYSGPVLQNDLNLTVSGTGERKNGNMEGGDGFDRTNNVEQVTWSNVSAGSTYKVTIQAYSVPFFTQPYAYAWRLFPSPIDI